MRVAQRAAILALLIASCYRDTASPLSNGAPAGQPIDDQLGFLPVDSEIVLGLDVAALRATPLWSRFMPKIEEAIGSDLEELRTACGFDPFKTVQRVSVGARVNDDDLSGVFVVHGVPGGKLLDCVAKLGKADTITTDRGVVVVREGHQNSAWTIVGDTAIIQVDRVAGRDSLAAVIASGAPLRKSTAFMELYDHLDHRAALWGAGNGASKAFDDLKGARPRWADVVVHADAGLTAVAHIYANTPAAAHAIDAQLEPTLDQIKPFVAHATGKLDGKMVTIDVALTIDQLAAAFALVMR